MVNRIRKGVSPVIATTIIIAITLVVGFASWSFVNSGASAASGVIGQSTASNVNYLRERFVITNVALDYTNNRITVWFYNNGAINTKIVEIYTGTDPNMLNLIPLTPLSLPIKEMRSITISYSISSGNTYYIKAIGEFGNVVLYYQKA
jgi:flagellin-like protein